ncbi:MAG: type V CRISPR-associated protein Cas4 [bacterium]|nr:type V CRISPR-associated protein Cas4 [bacterium]
MEQYIQISKLNDFLYSPQSLYLHSVYESFGDVVYKEEPQLLGQKVHEAIEDGRYSSEKRYLLGLSVYSEKYNLGGKIDIYDQKTRTLIERKARIKTIYDGHRYQLWAQRFCLEEMGYHVDAMVVRSVLDNKKYTIRPPVPFEVREFEYVLKKIREYDPCKEDPFRYRCDLSIYRHLSY